MTTRISQVRLCQLHRIVAPIMLPILLTLITDAGDRAFELSSKAEIFDWLLDLHIGHLVA